MRAPAVVHRPGERVGQRRVRALSHRDGILPVLTPRRPLDRVHERVVPFPQLALTRRRTPIFPHPEHGVVVRLPGQHPGDGAARSVRLEFVGCAVDGGVVTRRRRRRRQFLHLAVALLEDARFLVPLEHPGFHPVHDERRDVQRDGDDEGDVNRVGRRESRQTRLGSLDQEHTEYREE